MPRYAGFPTWRGILIVHTWHQFQGELKELGAMTTTLASPQMNTLLTPAFVQVTASCWGEAKDLGQRLLQTYVFRGMRSSQWPLRTSLERAATQFGIRADDRPLQERAILAAFKSRAQQYIQSPPDEKNNIEWLSLIQENGGPTRLLDFTESFYIATFFAV